MKTRRTYILALLLVLFGAGLSFIDDGDTYSPPPANWPKPALEPIQEPASRGGVPWPANHP